MHDLVITTLADRPELIDRVYDMEDSWPDFYFGELLSSALLHRVHGDFPEYCAMATTSDGTPVARAHCVPFQFGTEGHRAAGPCLGSRADLGLQRQGMEQAGEHGQCS